jgi:hypothetical protein
MSNFFDKLTSNLFETIIRECKKPDNQNKLKTYILDPSICYILDKIYPYIFITCAIFIIFIIIFLYMFYLLFRIAK